MIENEENMVLLVGFQLIKNKWEFENEGEQGDRVGLKETFEGTTVEKERMKADGDTMRVDGASHPRIIVLP